MGSYVRGDLHNYEVLVQSLIVMIINLCVLTCFLNLY